jgi:hypothetical protein
MEIPLVLRARGTETLVYSIPSWYRVLMAVIAGCVLASFAVGPSPTGLASYVVLALVALAGLYEERWTFDSGNARLVHRAGLLVAAKTLSIPFAGIQQFRIVPFVRGTVPGSADEASENMAALRGSRDDDSKRHRAHYKKPYLNLVCVGSDGTEYLINTLPARRAETIRAAAMRIAALCGKPLEEG